LETLLALIHLKAWENNMTYDPKFSVKQMYDQYGRSRSSSKKVDPKPSRSSGFGGMGPDPAERFGGSPTKGLGSKPTFNFGTDDSGSDNNPNRDEYESKGVVAKLYDRAVTTLRNFGADEPEDVIVDGQRVYKGPLFRGFDPTTRIENFGADNNPNRDISPAVPDSTMNIFGVNTDNPSLNMFGVRRNSFRNPTTQLIPPVLPESPANMDPMTRTLSQAMLPEPVEPTAEYTTQAGDTLFSIQKTLKENGINTTVEEIAEINDIGLDGIFGIKPGTELKLPMPSTDAAPKEVKAALEKLTPISMTEEKSLSEQLRDYTDYYKKLAADALGIDIETDQSKIETAVSLASKQYTIKKGDTLSKIARANGTTLSEMKKANPNIDPDKLRIGQTIKLPQSATSTEEVISEIKTIQVPDGNLKISTGTRSDHPTGLRISLDYNSATNPNAKGTLVVIPDNASQAVRDAAEKFNNLVVQFAASKGYEGYENRGVRTRSENKRGVSNTIHVEPFFQQDSKMEQIINENFAEFAKIYTDAFGGIDANMIAPHGNINSKGVQDKGATSKVFGTELDFGNRLIKELMDNQ